MHDTHEYEYDQCMRLVSCVQNVHSLQWNWQLALQLILLVVWFSDLMPLTVRVKAGGWGEVQEGCCSLIQPLQNVLNVAARIILRKLKFDCISADLQYQLHWLPVHQRIEYKGCVYWSTSAYKTQQQPISLKRAHQCLHLSTEIISALQHMAI